jgi:hypothetical protein
LGASSVAAGITAASIAWTFGDVHEPADAPPVEALSAAAAPASSARIATLSSISLPAQRMPPRETALVPGNVAPSLPMRVATDSGRAQPVFVGLMGARTARVGQAVSVAVTVESENDFAGAELTLEFDAKRMQLAAVRAGDFMLQRGVEAVVRHNVDAQAGRVTIEVTEQPGGPPASGGGSLVVIDFVPLQRGAATISFANVALRDSNDEGVASAIVGPLEMTVRD